jgi:3'-phosphoadenosine 5'-phosphosulfate sulfotransferase (PAPS reductase)/FAD synthetase
MIDLTTFDYILVNTSAGKDSQVMLDVLAAAAAEQGCSDKLRAVHCDLGRAEWQGVAELAQEQCDHYGIPLQIVKRPQGDLLDQILKRGMFPSSQARYCTSDQKRGQVWKVFTQLVRDSGIKGRRVRILNAMGLRMEESTSRAKRLQKAFDANGDYIEESKASNTKREVVDFHPIADWTEVEVWDRIKASGVRHHKAYDLGMPRLSCAFCVFAPRPALIIAGRENPELLETYIDIEETTGHTFRHNFSLVEIAEAIKNGETAKVEAWADVS